MAMETNQASGFVDRRAGRRGTRLDRKRRGIVEVSPTPAMMLHEVTRRYLWMAYSILGLSVFF